MADLLSLLAEHGRVNGPQPDLQTFLREYRSPVTSESFRSIPNMDSPNPPYGPVHRDVVRQGMNSARAREVLAASRLARVRAALAAGVGVTAAGATGAMLGTALADPIGEAMGYPNVTANAGETLGQTRPNLVKPLEDPGYRPRAIQRLGR